MLKIHWLGFECKKTTLLISLYLYHWQGPYQKGNEKSKYGTKGHESAYILVAGRDHPTSRFCWYTKILSIIQPFFASSSSPLFLSLSYYFNMKRNKLFPSWGKIYIYIYINREKKHRLDDRSPMPYVDWITFESPRSWEENQPVFLRRFPPTVMFPIKPLVNLDGSTRMGGTIEHTQATTNRESIHPYKMPNF